MTDLEHEAQTGARELAKAKYKSELLSNPNMNINNIRFSEESSPTVADVSGII